MIHIKDVHKSFGTLEVLKGINLEVARREVVCIIGPSGSGKSTLLRCVNHLEKLDSGHIFIEDVDLAASGTDIIKVRQQVGMVFQLFNLFPHKNAIENITLAPLTVKKMSRSEADDKAMALLKKVGLVDKARVFPQQLSGGQKQRVAIARALAMEPK